MARLVKAFGALIVALSLVPLTAAPASADSAGEVEFVTRLDDLRASRGLPRLTVDARLTEIARAWSATMAAQNRLYHNPSLASQLPSGWQKSGENVGYGSSVLSVHNALVASPPHLANMTDAGYNAVGIGVVVSGNIVWVTQVFMQTLGGLVTAAVAPIIGTLTSGSEWYRLAGAAGEVHTFGAVASLPVVTSSAPIVSIAAKSGGSGTWQVASDGSVFAHGDAGFYGSMAGQRLAQPIVGMAATPSSAGYWMVAADGGIFTFGDAGFFGSGPQRAPRPGAPRAVVGMVPSASGKGYWLAGASGELLAFGDAADLGGPSGLNRPLVGLAAPTRRTSGSSGGRSSGPGTTATPTAVPSSRPDRFSTSANSTWGTSPGEPDKAGRVLAMVETGGVVYLGGEFTGFVPPAGRPVTARSFLAAIDAGTGKLLSWNPAPDGSVRALVVSADGRRLYVGGDFNAIGGGSARNLAALDLATGALDPGFDAPRLNSGVRAMVLSGNRLYVGGNFTTVNVPAGRPGAGDHARPQVAAFDAATGALVRDWVPPANTGGRYFGNMGDVLEDGQDGLVHDLAVSADGRTVHVAGDFLHFGGRDGIVSLDASDGRPIAWQAETDRPIFALAISPTDGRTLYAATGGRGGRLWRLDPGGQTTPLWEVKTDGDNVDVLATGSMLYLIGHYDNIVPKSSGCYQACP
ncbi:MAG: CAP domain-containing protein, partial [Acidimicrobiales bacterium]